MSCSFAPTPYLQFYLCEIAICDYRELWDLSTIQRPLPIYPNPDCMCPQEYPVFDDSDPLESQPLCSGLGNVGNLLRSRVEMPEDSYFFSKDFINNDDVS